MESDGYVIPFDIALFPVAIIQGWHGPYSHFDLEPRYGAAAMDSSYAIDFQLPSGTAIFAARGGIISAIFVGSRTYYDGDDRDIGNQLPFGATNLIAVDHGDGTFALYSHLHYGSARVNLRDSVNQGQTLARTGLSGWIGRHPHLHFAVLRRVARQPSAANLILAPKAVTIPFKFENYAGPYEHSQLQM